MARPKRRTKIRRRVSRTKKLIRRFLGRTIVKDILVFLLLLGIFYFAFMGSLTLVFRTSSFWMAVTSDSMKHDGDLTWREYYTAREENSYRFPIQGGFEKGDLLIVQGVNSVSEIAIGDVLIIDRPYDIPLTHRVVEMQEENGMIVLRTKGDANAGFVSGDYPIKPSQILGKVVFMIPKLGIIPLWFQGKW